MLKTNLIRLAKNLSLLVDVAKDAEIGVDGGDCKNETVERVLRSKNSNGAGCPTPKARLTFSQLRKAFTKALILQHFVSKCHIRIETDASGYAIDGVLSQLTLDNLGQWHLVAYFSRKIIPGKTCYKTHDDKLLTVVETFKTWRHYLKGCKYKVFVFIDHNNLWQFMNTKNLSSCQVC